VVAVDKSELVVDVSIVVKSTGFGFVVDEGSSFSEFVPTGFGFIVDEGSLFSEFVSSTS